MTIYFGNVPPNSTLYIPFHTFNAAGASVTITGLAVTDIEIYKNGSVTQRSSDNGYTLLDTDGIDFDGLTGIHGFSVDLSDNSDSAFYVPGATYWVVVSSITADSQTVSFVAAIFRIDDATTGIVDQGTAQSVTSTTIRLRSAAAFADDELIGATVHIVSATTGAGQSRVITDYVSSTDTATVAAWTTTPTGTIVYKVFASPPNNFDAAASNITNIATAYELDGAVYRLTTNALEQSPSGTQYDLLGTGTATAGSSSSATSGDLNGYATNTLIGMIFEPTAGTGNGQRRRISANVGGAGASSSVTFEALEGSATVANTNTFKILKDGNVKLAGLTHTGATVPTVTSISSEVEANLIRVAGGNALEAGGTGGQLYGES